MGTSLDRAQELLDLIVSEAATAEVTLPTLQWSQLGDPVIACESVVTSASSIVPLDGAPENCGPPQVVELVGAIARAYVCQNDDGTDNPAAIEAASAVMAEDGDVLWTAAYGLTRYLGPLGVSINWVIEGGLVYTSVTVTVGVL